MDQPFIIIPKITAKPGQADAVKRELVKMLEPTHQEAGCLTYTVHQDNNDPHVFFFYEIWESKVHLDAHMKTPHFLALFEALKELADSIAIHEVTKLEV